MEIAQRRGDKVLLQTAIDITLASLDHGWDEQFGGLRYITNVDWTPPHTLEADLKLWWPHGEALYALLLANAGLRVSILELSRDPVELPRAVGLDGESVRAFQRIGFGEDRVRTPLVVVARLGHRAIGIHPPDDHVEQDLQRPGGDSGTTRGADHDFNIAIFIKHDCWRHR